MSIGSCLKEFATVYQLMWQTLCKLSRYGYRFNDRNKNRPWMWISCLWRQAYKHAFCIWHSFLFQIAHSGKTLSHTAVSALGGANWITRDQTGSICHWTVWIGRGDAKLQTPGSTQGREGSLNHRYGNVQKCKFRLPDVQFAVLL